MDQYDIHAVTDLTGFGLAGHSYEMAKGSGVALEINVAELPLMREAIAMYERGVSTASNDSNRQLVENNLIF